MRAWVVQEPGPITAGPLRLVERRVPEPGPGEVLLRVNACGVCRTDLHLAEGDLAPRAPAVVPGHQVIGRVTASGQGARRFAVGDRVGVAWLRGTCGRCRYCRRGRENLCPDALFTGWDADGGFAEYAVVPESFAYRIPDRYDDVSAAPLLCAGIVGYRALRRAELPPGGRLGIYGFGGSAHLTAQLAVAEGARVHVLTRSAAARSLALELGAASAGDSEEGPPEPLDAAVLFAPAGDLVPRALAALDRGGILSVAGIHLSDVPPLRYAEHLFDERQVRSTTANTRADGEEFLSLAERIPLRVLTVPFGLAEADQALVALATGRISGAGVLLTDG
ncbi:MAG: zinc-dependent alcohol dehydrogenase family protein [Actinomycetales bacterium]|nr:zinc-dependent alcohol dehydrogenase family protein [Actinomycetales bacterium]